MDTNFQRRVPRARLHFCEPCLLAGQEFFVRQAFVNQIVEFESVIERVGEFVVGESDLSQLVCRAEQILLLASLCRSGYRDHECDASIGRNHRHHPAGLADTPESDLVGVNIRSFGQVRHCGRDFLGAHLHRLLQIVPRRFIDPWLAPDESRKSSTEKFISDGFEVVRVSCRRP